MPPTPAAGGDREGWVLALETRDLLTVNSLEAIGFQAHHIVVPNPVTAEVQAIRGVQRALVCCVRAAAANALAPCAWPSCAREPASQPARSRPSDGTHCVCSDEQRGGGAGADIA